MIRSRMLTPGFRLYLGFGLFLLVAALVVGLSTQLQVEGQTVGEVVEQQGIVETVLGPMSLGWKGGVGNHLAYSVLLVGAVAATLMAGLLIAFRDADPEAQAEVVHTESVPLTRAPAGASYLPIVAAVGVALTAAGWAMETLLVYAGAAVIVLAGGTWAIRAWAERATGDDQVNAAIYHRFIDPLRVPVLATLGIAFVVLAFSQVLLAAPDKNVSAAAFGIVGLAFFIITVFVALTRPNRAVIAGLIVLGVLGLLAAAIWAVAVGPREIEHHGSEGSHGSGQVEEEPAVDEGGLAPVGPVTTTGVPG